MRSIPKQKGFTLIELIIAVFALVFVFGIMGGGLWVAAHFIAKFW